MSKQDIDRSIKILYIGKDFEYWKLLQNKFKEIYSKKIVFSDLYLDNDQNTNKLFCRVSSDNYFSPSTTTTIPHICLKT
jgi:hypothetical protein